MICSLPKAVFQFCERINDGCNHEKLVDEKKNVIANGVCECQSEMYTSLKKNKRKKRREMGWF